VIAISYYPAFELPAWFEGPASLRQRLADLWACRYKALYEKPQPGHEMCSLATAYDAILDALEADGIGVGLRRFVYLGLSLALACAPTVESYRPGDPRPRLVIDAVQDWLDGAPSRVQAQDWQILRQDQRTLRPPEGVIQDLDEALDALWNLTRLVVQPDHARLALHDMLDDCLEGFAIHPGGSTRPLELGAGRGCPRCLVPASSPSYP